MRAREVFVTLPGAVARLHQAMTLPELDLSIWRIPHHPRHDDWGHIIYVADTVLGDDPGGLFQSLRDVKGPRLPELNPAFPVQEFSVPPEAIAALARELDNINYSLQQHPFTPMLGGGLYGLRVVRGYQEFVVAWHGLFEDQDAKIKSIYRDVERLAGRPPTVGSSLGVYPPKHR